MCRLRTRCHSGSLTCNGVSPSSHSGTTTGSTHFLWPHSLCTSRGESPAGWPGSRLSPEAQQSLCMGLLLPKVLTGHLQAVGSISLTLMVIAHFQNALDAKPPCNTQTMAGDPKAAWSSGAGLWYPSASLLWMVSDACPARRIFLVFLSFYLGFTNSGV